jgi:HNH endonuclease
MAKITIDIPDDLFTQLTKETTNTEILERRLPELLRLGLSPGKLPADVYHYVHGGKTDAENLAYTCWRCNRHKGSDLGSFVGVAYRR